MLSKITEKIANMKKTEKEYYQISDWFAIVLIYTFAVVSALGTFASIITGCAVNTCFFLLVPPFAVIFIICLSVILFIEFY